MEGVNGRSVIHLPTNIRTLRKKLNISQEELANRIGLNRGNIASYENGSAEPRICNLLKLADFFGVSLMDLAQSDLSDPERYEMATTYYQQMEGANRAVINHFVSRAEEIDEVLEGLHKCCHFQFKSLNEPSREVQILMGNFEQLHLAAKQLFQEHNRLLDFMKCHIK